MELGRGRGLGATLPAWMTTGPQAPGSAAPAADAGHHHAGPDPAAFDPLEEEAQARALSLTEADARHAIQQHKWVGWGRGTAGRRARRTYALCNLRSQALVRGRMGAIVTLASLLVMMRVSVHAARPWGKVATASEGATLTPRTPR